MLDRQVDRRLDRVVGVGDAVVGLVFRLQAVAGSRPPRPPSVRRRRSSGSAAPAPVLLEDAAVFWKVVEPMQRRSPDASAGNQVGRVHGAADAGTGADDGVDLVDEQDRVRHLLQRRQHRLQALLEIAAVLGAGDQRARSSA